MVIGITGKSASGKSALCKGLSEKGAFVIDVDTIHKRVAHDNEIKIAEIFAKYGHASLSEKDKVRYFFQDNNLRKEIDALLFPLTFEEVKKEVLEAKASTIIIDAPLLFGMGIDSICNRIWLVFCEREENIKRLMKRNGISYEIAEMRVDAISFVDKEFYGVVDATDGIDDFLIGSVLFNWECVK